MRKIFLSFVLSLVALAVSFAAEPAPMKWTIDGVQREALIFPPSKATKAAPVIFAFHGHGGNMQFAARGMAFQNFWPEAIIVYPQGLPMASLFPALDKELRPGWQRDPGQLGDRDLKLVDAILATLHEKYSLDDRRIYAAGFSNGGFFTYLLWAERPNIFAAFAPGAATLRPEVHPTQPRPVLHFGGEQDRLVRFAEQRKTIDAARQLNGCGNRSESCGENCTLYPSARGAPVEAFIHPFGHVYPPGVTAVIVKFFQDHPRNS